MGGDRGAGGRGGAGGGVAGGPGVRQPGRSRTRRRRAVRRRPGAATRRGEPACRRRGREAGAGELPSGERTAECRRIGWQPPVRHGRRRPGFPGHRAGRRDTGGQPTRASQPAISRLAAASGRRRSPRRQPWKRSRSPGGRRRRRWRSGCSRAAAVGVEAEPGPAAAVDARGQAVAAAAAGGGADEQHAKHHHPHPAGRRSRRPSLPRLGAGTRSRCTHGGPPLRPRLPRRALASPFPRPRPGSRPWPRPRAPMTSGEMLRVVGEAARPLVHSGDPAADRAGFDRLRRLPMPRRRKSFIPRRTAPCCKSARMAGRCRSR